MELSDVLVGAVCDRFKLRVQQAHCALHFSCPCARMQTAALSAATCIYKPQLLRGYRSLKVDS